ncbi:MAG TPA: hypothetical protein VFJ43_07915, partial [Bacteroidia bacterium]|nr:hypothetical protein [Bacteroidia bacterium]
KSAAVRHSLLRNLNIWIDSYDDLFSDFDSRHFSERAISDDFLREMNKLTEEKEELIKTLHFQIPAKLRDEKTEAIIIDRLSNDFQREYQRFANELNSNRRRGFFMAIFGFACLISTVILTSADVNKLWQNSLKILFEPAGWFLIWSGFEKMFFGGEPVKRKRDFYARLEKCKIEFVSI